MPSLLRRLNFTNPRGGFVTIFGKQFHTKKNRTLFVDDAGLDTFFLSRNLSIPVVDDLFVSLLLGTKTSGARLNKALYSPNLVFDRPGCAEAPKFVIDLLKVGFVSDARGTPRETTTRDAYVCMLLHLEDRTDLSFFHPDLFDPPDAADSEIYICDEKNDVISIP
jgi:hypothetical protein